MKRDYLFWRGILNEILLTDYKSDKYTIMKCNHCEKEIQEGSKFCPYCGQKVEQVIKCPNCGNSIRPGDNFCMSCGCKVGSVESDSQIQDNCSENQKTVPTEESNNSSTLRKNVVLSKLPLYLGIIVCAVIISAGLLYGVAFLKQKTNTGSLFVDFEPAGCDVILNGKKVGVTPLYIKDLAIGSYSMEISKEYYIKEFYNIKVIENQEWTETGKLHETEFGRLLINAENELNSNYVSDYDEASDSREYVYRLMDYYRYGHTYGPSGIAIDYCSMDSFHIPINPVEAVSIKRKVISVRGLDWEDRFDPELDDVSNSLYWARQDAAQNEQIGNNTQYYPDWYNGFYAPLAWHLFYGIGCEKDVAEAIRLIKKCCTKDGEYKYPAYKKLIRDMGLENELKYNPELDCHRLNCPKCSGPQYIQDGTKSWRCKYCGFDVTLTSDSDYSPNRSDGYATASAVETNSYGPEWLNGTWSGRFSMDILGKVSYFTVRLEINQKTGKIRSIDVDNNQVDEGTYYVEDGVIRAFYPIAGGTTVTYDIDEQNRRIDFGDGHYLRKQ